MLSWTNMHAESKDFTRILYYIALKWKWKPVVCSAIGFASFSHCCRFCCIRERNQSRSRSRKLSVWRPGVVARLMDVPRWVRAPRFLPYVRCGVPVPVRVRLAWCRVVVHCAVPDGVGSPPNRRVVCDGWEKARRRAGQVEGRRNMACCLWSKRLLQVNEGLV